ncbi:MAG: hypothetical protein QW727_03210 [Candidatus Pacearchaeota archaeon]
MGVANDFLYEFTRELIINSAPSYIYNKIVKMDIEKKSIEKEIENALEKNSEGLNRFKVKPVIKIISPYKEKTELAEDEESSESKNLNAVSKMINDPNIVSIECPGPGRYIMIRTYAKSFLSKISLNKEEINSILNDFSKEARIPRIGGVFKAIVNNLVITAIDSEFSGPRFIIQKIHPRSSKYL